MSDWANAFEMARSINGLVERIRCVLRLVCVGAFIALYRVIALGQTPTASSEAASEELALAAIDGTKDPQ
jgi:hypothetical protein